MATDTTTAILQLLLMGTGNDNNSWGDNLNSQVIQRLENAVTGVTSIDLSGAGGSLTLTDDQAVFSAINFGGALTADTTVFVPANRVRNHWTFINVTTGGFSLLVKVVGGTAAIQIPQFAFEEVILLGGNTPFRKRRDQVGNMFIHAGVAVPYGCLECDGSIKSIASFPDLYNAIGTTWGGNGISTFALPPGTDTGRFLRSRSAGVPVGTVQSNQNKSHSHIGGGTTSSESADHAHVGSGTTTIESADHAHSVSGTTSGQSASHTHSTVQYYVPNVGTLPGGGGNNPLNANGSGQTGGNNFGQASGAASNDHTHTFSATTSGRNAAHTHDYSFTTSGRTAVHTHAFSFTTSSDGGAETRPEAIVGILCIRY